MNITIIPYQEVDDRLKGKILHLQNMQWENCNWGDTPYIHACICCFEGETLVGYLSIVKKEVTFKGETYIASGLSEVVTHMDYRNSGIGLRMVQAAFTYMEKDNCDLSIFTCNKELVHFYAKGGWQEGNRLSLIGGTIEKPMNSHEMNVQPMIALFSEKAHEKATDFEEGELYLGVGEGKMW